LCQEPDLDFVILGNEFPNMYAATNGRVYLYDCRQVRARLNLPVLSAQADHPKTRTSTHDPS
jgi:hypothetical protein